MEPCGECESCLSFAQGRSYCIHELDAASNNSVDDIRNLTDMVRIPPQIGKYSVFIIDEVHMLSAAAFNAFLKTLEEPPAHAIFILATTEKHKILPTILSRCQTYDFNRITIPDIVKNLTDIALKEGITIDSDALHIIAIKADGSMRDALTLFDQTVAFCGKEIKYEEVIKNLNVLDYEYYFDIINYSLAQDYISSLKAFDKILAQGFNALHFISGLSAHLRDLIVCKNNSSEYLLSLPPTLIDRYKEQAGKCSVGFIFNALGITTACEANYRQSGNQRLLIEFTLMKLAFLLSAPIVNDTKAAPKAAETPKAAKAAEVVDTSTVADSHKTPEASTTADASITADSPKVAEAPKIAEAPKVAEAPKTSQHSISLKEMLKQAQEKVDNPNGQAEPSHQDSSFDLERFNAVWKKLAELEIKAGRKVMGTTLLQYPLNIDQDKYCVTFFVGNSAQQAWIKEKCLNRFTDFVRKETGNHKIYLEIGIYDAGKDNEGDKKELYMPTQKAAFMLDNNEELKELKNDLDLHLK